MPAAPLKSRNTERPQTSAVGQAAQSMALRAKSQRAGLSDQYLDLICHRSADNPGLLNSTVGRPWLLNRIVVEHEILTSPFASGLDISICRC